MDDLYRDVLLEHYKNPKNFGRIPDADVVAEETNASCGDSIIVYVKKTGKSVDQIQFEGQGCAVSTAFTSMLIEYLQAKRLDVEQILAMGEEELLAVVGLAEISPTRKKCATLGLKAIKKALKEVT